MFVISLILIVALTLIDQILKYLVANNIFLGDTIEVIKFGETKIFSLTHIRNSGAAWSIMSGKTWFLIGLPIAVIIVGLIYLFHIKNGSKLAVVSLSVLIAGGIGNLIDRIRFHEVIDYIQFNPINFPVFNFADICVVIGGLIFCFYYLIFDEIKKKKNKLEKSDG